MKTTVLFAAMLVSAVTGYSQELKSSTSQKTKSTAKVKATNEKTEAA